jgi:hypothetical protein
MTFHEFYSHSNEDVQRKFRETKLLDFHKLLLPHDKFTELSNHGRQMMSHFRSTYTCEQFLFIGEYGEQALLTSIRRLEIRETSSCCNYLIYPGVNILVIKKLRQFSHRRTFLLHNSKEEIKECSRSDKRKDQIKIFVSADRFAQDLL